MGWPYRHHSGNSSHSLTLRLTLTLTRTRTLPLTLTLTTQALLDHGADPNVANTSGNSPLHFAFERENEELTMTLIDGGIENPNPRP